MKYLIWVSLLAVPVHGHAVAGNSRAFWFSGSCNSLISPDEVVKCTYAKAPDYRNSSCQTKAGATATGRNGTPDDGNLEQCSTSHTNGSCHGWGLWNCTHSKPLEWYAYDQIWFNTPAEVDRYHDKTNRCEPHFGNPIYPLTGSKRVAVDLKWSGLPLELVYSTRRSIQISGAVPSYAPTAIPSFGALWETNFHRSLVFQGSKIAIQASRGNGTWISFVRNESGVYQADLDVADRLVGIAGGNWRYFDSATQAEEDYDADGRLLSIAYASGSKLSFTYSAGVVAGTSPVAGLLIVVVDEKGRSLQFHYEQVGNLPSRIYKIVRPENSVIQASYDAAGNLITFTWPDTKTKQFVYERADLPWAMTGVKDEAGIRTLTYGYDSLGRAVDTQASGGATHFHVSWGVPPGWQITETYDRVKNVIWRDHWWIPPQDTVVTLPNNQALAFGVADILGMPRTTTQSQPGGSGCEASTSTLSYDGRGNVTSRLDFNSVLSCHAYAADRSVETYRLEGLRRAESCPSDLAGAQVESDKAQRKVSMQWHPLWKLETRRAEPKRITTTVYNGQKDPIKKDGIDVICAPAAPALPDGSKVAVVCTRYEQSTEDETGNLGFDASVKETRKWSYTYNPYGQLLTETDPRGKVASYEYYADTSFAGEGNAARGHWMGDLKTATNALNQTTNHLEYNKRGQVLTAQYANGSQEQREYHVRGWQSKVTLVPAGGGAGQVTQYDYFDTGLLKKVTQPDGSYASYTWDDAHRLTDVTDSVGNKVHYELDNAGNRTAEQFKDPGGHLAKTINRTFDALGRMSSSTGAQ